MSNVILEELKALSRKIPNLPELVAEAAKPVERPTAETAFVYNGFDDVTLQYLGAYTYKFQKGHVARIDPLPNHREVDSERTKGGRDLHYMTIPLKGEFIARELIDRRSYDKKGLVVFTEAGDPKESVLIDGVQVPKAIVEAANSTAEAFKLQAIEEFILKREKAKAGIMGNPMRPHQQLYDWMKHYRGDDEMFAERNQKADSNAMLATAVDKIAEIANTLTTMKVDAAGMPPRRRPMESEENYKKRVAEWALGKDSKDTKE